MKAHQLRGGRPARIYAGLQVGCSRSGPPLYRQNRGSVHSEGMPHSLLPLSPTKPADGTRSCWDFQPNGENHMWTMRAPQGIRLVPMSSWVAQSKALRDDGCLWWLWCHLIKTKANGS